MDAKTDISARLPSQRVTEGSERASGRSCDSAGYVASNVFKKTPSIAGLKLSGRDVAKDLIEVAAAPLLTRMQRDDGFPDVERIIVAGRTTAENLKSVTAHSNHSAVVTRVGAAKPGRPATRARDRILALTALGLIAGLSPALAFEGTVRPSVDVPAAMPPISRAVRSDVPRPPGAIPNSGFVPAAAIPNAPLPRPTGPVPALAAPSVAPADRPLPPPATSFAAPAAPITPFEALKSGTRALKDGDTNKARISLEYAADQGLVSAQWKLGRMYADGDGVDQSDIKAFEYFSGIADAHADDNPGTPQARYIANAFVALGHYYREGIPNSDVRADLGRARHMYAYAASYFGDPDAQYHLGRMMLDPKGPFRDTRQAARWLNSAANKGQHQAQAILGRILFKGEPGIPRQAARGLMWLTLARSNAASSENWISELHDAAVKQSTEEERALAGDYLTRWVNGQRAQQ